MAAKKRNLVTIESYREDGRVRGGCKINFQATKKEQAHAVIQLTRAWLTVADTYGFAIPDSVVKPLSEHFNEMQKQVDESEATEAEGKAP